MFWTAVSNVPLIFAFWIEMKIGDKKWENGEFTAKVVFIWKKKPKLIQFSNYLPKYSFEYISAIHVNKPYSSNLFFYFGDPIFSRNQQSRKYSLLCGSTICGSIFSSHRLRLPPVAPTSSSHQQLHQQLGKFFSGSWVFSHSFSLAFSPTKQRKTSCFENFKNLKLFSIS